MSGTRKASTLQAALTKSSGRAEINDPLPQPPTDHSDREGGSKPGSSREGKANISAWLAADYQVSLRMIHAMTGRSKQALIAEALNDLFGKYNVPKVRVSQTHEN